MSNVIDLDRARRLKQQNKSTLRFPDMYIDVNLAAMSFLAELDWLADNDYIPDDLMGVFGEADHAIRQAVVRLAIHIECFERGE